MRTRLLVVVLVVVSSRLLAPARGASSEQTPRKPNIIFMLADDLGYADLGCYGQKKIQTPSLDRMAAEGTRFTQAYCGTSVCAPSRCSLMTGLHTGHAWIRANREIKPEGQEPLPPDTFTVGRLLQQAGYKTACIGKWGLGGPGSTGSPEKQGFDHFFGYLCQRMAHEYYPDHLWRDTQRVDLDGKQYSHDLIAREALQWVRENRDHPFFLYLTFTIPHANMQVPDLGGYAKEDWPADCKTYAAMVSRMDGDIGRLLALLKELGIDDNTLVFFASDNGSAGGAPAKCFQSCDSLRGIKRDMYEGGLRVPMIVRWPGKTPAGKVSDAPWVFYDFLPTCAQLTGAKVPAGVAVDGVSVLPALLGGEMPKRGYFYWELHEHWTQQAVRMGDWKAVKIAPSSPIELYNLALDPSESHDVAASHPEVLARAGRLLQEARTDSKLWPVKDARPLQKKRAASRPEAE